MGKLPQRNAIKVLELAGAEKCENSTQLFGRISYGCEMETAKENLFNPSAFRSLSITCECLESYLLLCFQPTDFGCKPSIILRLVNSNKRMFQTLCVTIHSVIKTLYCRLPVFHLLLSLHEELIKFTLAEAPTQADGEAMDKIM